MAETNDVQEHPRATGSGEPYVRRDPPHKPPTTHQPQTDWWYEGEVSRALPYCVHVVGRRVEILDRRYRLIIALWLKRAPTDQRLKSISHSGEVRNDGDGSRKAWLYNDGCAPDLAWASYVARLKKLGQWSGVRRV